MIDQDEPHYYYWKHEIPPDICDAIVAIGEGLKMEAGGLEVEGFQDLNMRDSKVSWIGDRWITTMLHSYVNLANKEMWNYDLFPDQGIPYSSSFHAFNASTTLYDSIRRIARAVLYGVGIFSGVFSNYCTSNKTRQWCHPTASSYSPGD